MLWPDEDPDATRNRLRQALSTPRRLLEPIGVPDGSVLIAGRSEVRLSSATPPGLRPRQAASFCVALRKAGALCYNGNEREKRSKRAAPSRMGHYIRSVRWLSARSKQIDSPPKSEIEMARRVLSRSPVAGYPAFTAAEVRLLAIYRAYLSQGVYDDAWQSIQRAAEEAWAYAVHEAVELQTFAELGVDPFDEDERHIHMNEAHLQATIFELRYVREWARQGEMDVTELALEIENPLREVFPHSHARLIRQLQARQEWTWPAISDLQTARLFWQRLLKGTDP